MRWTEQELADFHARSKTGVPNAVDVSDPPFKLPADSEPVTITLAGDPVAKGRGRISTRGSIPHVYTPQKTRAYEAMVKAAAIDAMAGRPPTERPVELTLRAMFPIPKSFSKAKRTAALLGELLPAKRPDLDNIIKAFTDGMNGVVYRDDCQIVRHGVVEKRYGPIAFVVATVRAV